MDVQKIEIYINQLATGSDISALENLYNETRSYIFRFAFSILKNKEEAEDVMQDTYININRYASKYNPKTKPIAWMLTITKNLCLNKFKKDEKNNNIDITEYENILVAEQEDITNKLLLECILQSLTDEERQIFVLHSVKELKFREIGEIISMKESTVISKYHRAMKKVREKFERNGAK